MDFLVIILVRGRLSCHPHCHSCATCELHIYCSSSSYFTCQSFFWSHIQLSIYIQGWESVLLFESLSRLTSLRCFGLFEWVSYIPHATMCLSSIVGLVGYIIRRDLLLDFPIMSLLRHGSNVSVHGEIACSWSADGACKSPLDWCDDSLTGRSCHQPYG